MASLTAQIAGVCSVLLETPGPVPASSIYLALGCDFGAWQRLQLVMCQAGLLAQCGSSQVALTPAGEELGRKVNALLAARTA